MFFSLLLIFALFSIASADSCGVYNGSCFDCTMNGCRFCYSDSYAVPPLCTSSTDPTAAGCIDTNEGGTGILVTEFYQCIDCGGADDCRQCSLGQYNFACSWCWSSSSCVARDGSSNRLSPNWNTTSTSCSSDGLTTGNCNAPCEYRGSCDGCIADSKCSFCNQACVDAASASGECLTECPIQTNSAIIASTFAGLSLFGLLI